MKHDKHKPVCPYCGSDEIQGDATATWDVAAQEWVLEQVMDTTWCSVCDAPTKPTWEPVA